MKKILIVILLFIPSLLFSLDFMIYGSVDVAAGYHYLPDYDPQNKFSGDMTFDGNHRLSFDAGDFFVHHRLSINEEGDFSHNLYEAYLYMMPLDIFGFSLGKQRVNWGTSYVFSPTDKMHSSAGILDQETGFPGIALFLPVTADINITGCVGVEDVIKNRENNFWEDIRYGITGSFLFGKFEFFTSFVYQNDAILLPGAGLSYDFFGFILTAETAVEFTNQILYPENSYTWNKPETGKPYLYLDFGFEKTFSGDYFSFFLNSEYLFRQAGYDDDEADYFFDVLADDYASETLSIEDTVADELLRKHYLFISLGFEYFDLLNFENSILLNFQDASFIANHKFTFIKLDALDIYTEASWSFGDDNTEFGFLPEKAAITAGAELHF
jgi:hypothetical protein